MKPDKRIIKRDDKGKWLQGECPNPGGRPRSIAALVRENTGDGEVLIKKALKLLNSKSKYVVLETIKWLVERGWGKVESIAIDEFGGETKYDIRKMLFIELGKDPSKEYIDTRAIQQDLANQQPLQDSDQRQKDNSIQVQ